MGRRNAHNMSRASGESPNTAQQFTGVCRNSDDLNWFCMSGVRTADSSPSRVCPRKAQGLDCTSRSFEMWRYRTTSKRGTMSKHLVLVIDSMRTVISN